MTREDEEAAFNQAIRESAEMEKAQKAEEMAAAMEYERRAASELIDC